MRVSRKTTGQVGECWRLLEGRRASARIDSTLSTVSEECDGRSATLAKVAAERSHIEDAVHQLASSLILAQESERKRIAAELHDSINQDLAIIAIDLGRLAQSLPDSGEGIRQQILAVQQRAVALSNEVRNLSHSLHPSVVDHLGLAEAIRTYCAGFESREHIQVTFTARNVSGKFAPKVQLAAYRICQEALCNVRKHARAAAVRVGLRLHKGLLTLTISDSGCGFLVGEPALSHGLGLVSMWERCRLADGNFEIQSQLGVGTEVRASLPSDGGQREY